MIPWFDRVGTPLAPPETDALHALLLSDPLLAGARLVAVTNWAEASGAARAMDVDAEWWDHEEAERERLWLLASHRVGEAELIRQLTAVTDGVAAGARTKVGAAAARAGIADPVAIGDATAAVLLAAHHNALAELAGEDWGHGFARKYALFAGGRWPLGYHHGRYLIF